MPAGIIVLEALDGDVADALAERPVVEDRGRIGVGEDQRAVRGGRAQRLHQVGRQGVRQAAGAAAIDHQPLGAVAQLEGQGRGAAGHAIFAGGGGAASMTRMVPSADSR